MPRGWHHLIYPDTGQLCPHIQSTIPVLQGRGRGVPTFCSWTSNTASWTLQAKSEVGRSLKSIISSKSSSFSPKIISSSSSWSLLQRSDWLSFQDFTVSLSIIPNSSSFLIFNSYGNLQTHTDTTLQAKQYSNVSVSQDGNSSMKWFYPVEINQHSNHPMTVLINEFTHFIGLACFTWQWYIKKKNQFSRETGGKENIKWNRVNMSASCQAVGREACSRTAFTHLFWVLDPQHWGYHSKTEPTLTHSPSAPWNKLGGKLTLLFASICSFWIYSIRLELQKNKVC